jgi:hypothetical protein
MSSQRTGKLNWLQLNVPEGLLVDAAWLERRGYSSALRSKYVKHGWLQQVVRGLYRRPPATFPAASSDEVRWEQVVISLQTMLHLPFVVGGRTALELQGFAHYLSPGGLREIHLYGEQKVPGWVYKLNLKTSFIFHNAEKLFHDKPIHYITKQSGSSTREDITAAALQRGFTFQLWGQWQWPLMISLPERASLELLDDVPQRETFQQADVLMEGLRNLRPRLLHTLLVECRSVKVKRLFLWFAERHDHPWITRLDRRGIDLGQGKRMLVSGGKLDTKYNITVPEKFDASR